MKVSLNTIKQYTTVNLSLDELLAKINGQLGGVEGVVDLGERYKDVRIVRIASCGDHPNADRLHVCKIDDDKQVAGVPRDEDGYIQVVCGAPNVRAGMFAVWLPPKSTVPASFADKEPFVLDARELRGVLSQGMMASPKELGLGDDHDGILEIDPGEWKPNNIEITAGIRFADAYGLNDTIIEIENKMFTHRPDLFGQLGVAREIAGIQHTSFTSPDWYKVLPEFNSGEGLQLTVKNNAYETVPRFMAVAIKDVVIKPSPVWLRCELVRLGSKPINNIVDVTNYIMLLTAQPVHAYDYDKLGGHALEARMARSGEEVTLLNHKTYKLDETDILIADGEGPVGLAGIMGGGDSEVSSDTRNVVLEVATFDMYTVRKSSMRHGIFTDALTRFNKGQSPLQNPYVLNLLMQSIADVAGGAQASAVCDERKDFYSQATVSVSAEFVNSRLGLELTADEIRALLHNVEFEVTVEQDAILAKVPFWRTDIELPEDIVEEVGRLYGFDKLPRELPKRSMKPVARSPKLRAKSRIREAMKRAGANEVLTYSFVHANIMKRAGQDPLEAFRLSNALSPDLQYYRLSVLPSLLDKVHANIKSGYDEFVLYEIGKVHGKSELDSEGLPKEFERLGGVAVAGDKASRDLKNAPYYLAGRYVAQLLTGRNVQFRPLKDSINQDQVMFDQLCRPFDRSRSAAIYYQDKLAGVVGELNDSVRSQFKLPAYSAGFELFMSVFMQLATDQRQIYRPLSKYPTVSQDITLEVQSDLAYEIVYRSLSQEISKTFDDRNYRQDLLPVSIYQPTGSNTKTIAFRLLIASYETTLTDAEVNDKLDSVAVSLAQKIDARRV